MYIANAYYKAIPVTGATFPLAAGTIVTANGTVPASAEQYFGIVPEKVDKMPTTGYIFVAVSGTIDLDTCGVTFTDAQIKALGADFNFVRAKEEHEPPAPELPTVSAADNGKVLTVVDGEWAAASGGGGGGGLLVHISFPQNPEDPATLDKNWNEINAVVQSGVTPVFMDGIGGIFTCTEVSSEDDEYFVSLIDLADNEQKIFPFISDSATGVLTYTPEP